MTDRELKAQGLREYIIEALGKMDLGLDHQSRLDDVVKGTGGDFIPKDLDLALMDIRMWVIDEEVDKLLALAKKLPSSNGTGMKKLVYYIDGKRLKPEQKRFWFMADSIKGKRTLKGSNATNKPFADMDNEELEKFKGISRAHETMYLQWFGEPEFDTPKTASESFVPAPIADVDDSSIREDDEDEIGANAEDEYEPDELGDDKNTPNPNEFEHNEPNKPWVNRPKGDKDA